jgi:hypothetical protein
MAHPAVASVLVEAPSRWGGDLSCSPWQRSQGPRPGFACWPLSQAAHCASAVVYGAHYSDEGVCECGQSIEDIDREVQLLKLVAGHPNLISLLVRQPSTRSPTCACPRGTLNPQAEGSQAGSPWTRARREVLTGAGLWG